MMQALADGHPDLCPFEDEDAFGLLSLLGADLATRYRPLAADEHLIDGQRQAALQLSIAEDYLNGGQNLECESAAEEALALFRGTGDEHGVIDALRLLLEARRSRSSATSSRLDDVAKPAVEELARCREASNARGVVCMRIFLAETRARHARGAKNLQTAKAIEEAMKPPFLEPRDKRIEVLAHLVLADAHFRMGRCAVMLDESDKALELAREIGDRECEARSLHGIALAHSLTRDFITALKRSKDSVALFQRLGAKRSEAAALLLAARLHLLLEEPQRALPLAQRALAGCRAARRMRDAALLGHALHMVVESLFSTAKGKPALQLVNELVEEYQVSENGLGEAVALTALAVARLWSSAAPEGALDSAEGALAVAKRLGEERLELKVLHIVGHVHLQCGHANQAVQALWDAAAAARRLRDARAEAEALEAMGRIYVQGGEVDAALDAAAAARSKCQDEGLGPAIEAASLLLLGRARRLQGKAGAALEAAGEALGLYQEACQPRGQAEALDFLVGLHESQRDLDKALQTAESWLELLERLGKKGPRAMAMQRVAGIHMESGDDDGAEKLAIEGLALCREAGDKRTEVQLCIVLVQAYLSQLQLLQNGQDTLETSSEAATLHWKAADTAETAVTVAEQYLVEDKGLRASASFWCANVLSWSSEPEATLERLARAADLFGEVGDVRSQATALVASADLHLGLGQRELAFCSADLALELAKECGDQQLEEAASAAKERTEWGFWEPTQLEDSCAPGDACAGAESADISGKLLELCRRSMPSGTKVSMDSPLMDSGADAVDMRRLMADISQEFQLDLRRLNFPTVRDLEEHIRERSEVLAKAY